MRVNAGQSPPFWLVIPFFLAAPAGLVAAGLLLLSSDADVFVAINAPRLVAVTHALVIGWITTTVIGATYQLGPAVIGGPLLSPGLARIQFGVHLLAVPLFVWSLFEWQTTGMALAGSLLALSFVLYFVNGAWSMLRGGTRSLPRAYFAVALAALLGAAGFGLTWAFALDDSWFPITLGRLSAHAHVALIGWLGITLMGVSYQLVPMFNVVPQDRPRFGRAALVLTSASLFLFVPVMLTEPGPATRVFLAILVAAGPLLWALDQCLLIRARARRRLDIQGRATVVSLAFLAAAALAGMIAASGIAAPTAEPARPLLVYAALGILGWFGIAVVGNTYKIVPFLVWFHRYSSQAGLRPVPLMNQIYSERAAHAVVVALASSALVLSLGAALGSLEVFRAGGALVAATGTVHEAALLRILLPHRASAEQPRTASGIAVPR